MGGVALSRPVGIWEPPRWVFRPSACRVLVGCVGPLVCRLCILWHSGLFGGICSTRLFLCVSSRFFFGSLPSRRAVVPASRTLLWSLSLVVLSLPPSVSQPPG